MKRQTPARRCALITTYEPEQFQLAGLCVISLWQGRQRRHTRGSLLLRRFRSLRCSSRAGVSGLGLGTCKRSLLGPPSRCVLRGVSVRPQRPPTRRLLVSAAMFLSPFDSHFFSHTQILFIPSLPVCGAKGSSTGLRLRIPSSAAHGSRAGGSCAPRARFRGLFWGRLT